MPTIQLDGKPSADYNNHPIGPQFNEHVASATVNQFHYAVNKQASKALFP